jgi:hypothetical protein
MSAKLKVVDDSRGAREAHHGEALAFGVVGSHRVGGRVACDARKQSSGRIRLLSPATWFNTPLVWLTFLCKSARAGSGSDAPSDTMGTGNAIPPMRPALLLGSDNVRNCAAYRRAAAANLALDIPQLPNPFQHRRVSEVQSDQ